MLLKKQHAKWLVSGLVLLLAACSHSGKQERVAAQSPEGAEASPIEQTASDYEAELRKLFRKHIEATARNVEAERQRVIRKKPHFYREYSVYPNDADDFEVLVQKTESLTKPCIADVTVAKLRFATRLHRKRDEARGDSNFLRDTGAEKVTFELRNNKWVRVGSLFVADKTEENVNGEWAPLKEEIQRTVAAEEEKRGSWLKRTWNSITGR